MTPPRWLSTRDAAVYLGFPSERAFYIFSRRNSIPFAHCGKNLRFLTTDLDAVLQKRNQPQQSFRRSA